jgi:hypothetical protein
MVPKPSDSIWASVPDLSGMPLRRIVSQLGGKKR